MYKVMLVIILTLLTGCGAMMPNPPRSPNAESVAIFSDFPFGRPFDNLGPITYFYTHTAWFSRPDPTDAYPETREAVKARGGNGVVIHSAKLTWDRNSVEVQGTVLRLKDVPGVKN